MSSVDARPVRRALLSVSDKTGLVDFARALSKLGVDLIQTVRGLGYLVAPEGPPGA